MPKIDATPEAKKLIHDLMDDHGPLMFHQSGGCCDGSSPMCYERNEFKTGNADVKLGEIEDQPFYMSKSQYEYWKHTHLTLDVVEGRGSSFSIEIPRGVRFIIRSRLLEKTDLE